MKKSVKIKNKVKLNDKKNHLRFSFVIICSVLLVLILFVVGFKGYNTVTGKVPYYNPLTPEELSLGVQLKKGSNTIIWSDETPNEDLLIQEALQSIIYDILYVYDYNERKYWFGPIQKYARYSKLKWYKNRLFSEIKPGHKYRIVLGNGAVLMYDVLNCGGHINYNSFEETDYGKNSVLYGEIVMNEIVGEESGGGGRGVGRGNEVEIVGKAIENREPRKFVIARDRCENNKNLIETSCEWGGTRNKVKFRKVECPNKCENGKCVLEKLEPFCIKDGDCIEIKENLGCESSNYWQSELNPFVSSEVILYSKFNERSFNEVAENIFNRKIEDSCVSNQVKRAFSCEPYTQFDSNYGGFKIPKSTDIICPEGYSCSNGKCVEEEITIDNSVGDVNKDGKVDSNDVNRLRDMIMKDEVSREADFDRDGFVDGYDLYRLEGLVNLRLGKDIRYPIREFLLSSENPIHSYGNDVLGEFSEFDDDGWLIKTWTIEHEKKGASRIRCNPPVLKINLKNVRKRDRLLGISDNGRNEIRYDEFRLVPDCDIWKGFETDNLIREYFIYWLFREFNVPSVDTIAFGKVRFNTPDIEEKDRLFNYIFLQRINSDKDEIPFMNQYGFSRIIDAVGSGYYFDYDYVNNNVNNNMFSFNIKRNDDENSREKLDFDSDNVIKYILLTSFVSLGDRSRFNNEDYGLDSIINKWKYIPYDHDLSFFCDSSPITNLVSELKSSGEEWANNRERTYDIIREIYDNPNNLYRMLEAIDKYPFRANKIKMKNEIKFRFYYSALYYGSREFAEELGVAHIPFNNKALYIREAEKIIEHEDNFDDLCSLSNSYRYSELSRLITQLSECQEGQFEIEDIEKSKTYIINGLKIELSSINKQDQNVNVLLIINDYNRVFLDNRNSAEHVSLVGKSYTIELVSSNENSITIKISCGYQGICEDSDGGINYYDLGISSDGKNSIEDRCVDDNKLIESVCNDNKVDTVEYECPDGCTNGYCKYFCIDSDGGVNSEVKGSAHSNGRVLFREVLKESDETKVLSSTKAQIKVRWNENIIDLELGQTIDIGLIEIFIKEINIISPNNIDNNVVIEFLRLNDFCYMGSLLEATCELNGKSNFVEKVCVNGCKDGACVQNELACKDSDNGLDYFTEGNVTLNNIEKTDYCTVSGGVFNTITEYSCNNGIIDESIYRCPNDCVIDVDGSVLGSCKLEKEICDNKIDDDNDEKKDCDDNDCLNDPLCKAVPVQAVEKTCVVGFSESKELRELQGVVINEEYVGLLSADENNGKITAIITTSGKTYTLTDTSRSVEVTVNNKKYKVELVSSTDSNSNIKVSSCT